VWLCAGPALWVLHRCCGFCDCAALAQNDERGALWLCGMTNGGRCAVHRLAVSLHASSPHSVALMQLRFASFAVINLRWDCHPQECARAGRTRKTPVAL